MENRFIPQDLGSPQKDLYVPLRVVIFCRTHMIQNSDNYGILFLFLILRIILIRFISYSKLNFRSLVKKAAFLIISKTCRKKKCKFTLLQSDQELIAKSG